MQTGENIRCENKHLLDTFYARMCSDGAIFLEGGGNKRENRNVRPTESVKFYRE